MQTNETTSGHQKASDPAHEEFIIALSNLGSRPFFDEKRRFLMACETLVGSEATDVASFADQFDSERKAWVEEAFCVGLREEDTLHEVAQRVLRTKEASSLLADMRHVRSILDHVYSAIDVANRLGVPFEIDNKHARDAVGCLRAARALLERAVRPY